MLKKNVEKNRENQKKSEKLKKPRKKWKKNQKWYFVTIIVLTYCEKKLF